MNAIKSFSLLALAGSTLAAPYRGHGDSNVHIVYETVVYTAYATVPYGGQPQPTLAPEPVPAPSAAAVEYTTVAAPEPSAPAPPAPSAPEPSAPAPSAPSAPESGDNTGYMGVVSEWRAKLGLSDLTKDATLEGNALKTAQDGNGQMVHQLNPGTMGQVLAPGGAEDFEKCFVGGWLCEKPDMAGMDGVCSTMSSGWYYTSTGHADILTSPSYSKIGCANAGGIWACDLA